jgi:hypothetical protein
LGIRDFEFAFLDALFEAFDFLFVSPIHYKIPAKKNKR